MASDPVCIYNKLGACSCVAEDLSTAVSFFEFNRVFLLNHNSQVATNRVRTLVMCTFCKLKKKLVYVLH